MMPEKLSLLPFEHEARMVHLEPGFAVDYTVVNYARWIKKVKCLL